VAEIHQVGAHSSRVERDVSALVGQLGPELSILEDLPLEEIRHSGSTLLGEAISRLRAGKVRREAGYDGEFGVIRVFEPGELERGQESGMLFDLPSMRPGAEKPKRTRRGPAVVGVDLSAAEALPGQEPSSPVSLGVESQPAMDPEAGVLAGLDPEQRAAAVTTRGPLLIVAGPGTGKTRTLTHRFAHLVLTEGVSPEQCLAITFTRKAAEEMRSRLEALLPGKAGRMTVTTFHGLGLVILREQRERLGLPEDFRIASEQERLALAAELFGTSGREGEKKLEEMRRDRSGADRARFAGALHARGMVDFDDLVEMPVRLLAEQPDVASAYRERFRWISVDEYQDVDREQYELVKLLSGLEGNVCVIGDPDQAIYGFRGADVGFFLAFERDYPTAQRVELTRNYRSTEAVVRGALQAIAPGSLVPGRALRAMAGSAGAAKLCLHDAPSPSAEAEFVVQAIEQLMGGFSHLAYDSGRSGGDAHGALGFSDFAVLYRTDAQSHALLEAFDRAGMPFQKRGHDRLLKRSGVPEVLHALRGVAQPSVPVAEQLASSVAWLCRIDPEREADYRGAQELLAPLAGRSERLEGFLDELALGAEVDALDPRADRVSLLTLHASKGLEFPVVFIVGCEDGLLPLRRNDEPLPKEALDEERRLFFVGMTRARSRLFLCRARRRTLYGVEREMPASPFLGDIAAELLAETKAAPGTAKRARRLKQLSLF
jgi:superfamily I DNA/RNA helicase